MLEIFVSRKLIKEFRLNEQSGRFTIIRRRKDKHKMNSSNR
jgi:hypothetical protein